jgi:hypothetical protein
VRVHTNICLLHYLSIYFISHKCKYKILHYKQLGYYISPFNVVKSSDLWSPNFGESCNIWRINDRDWKMQWSKVSDLHKSTLCLSFYPFFLNFPYVNFISTVITPMGKTDPNSTFNMSLLQDNGHWTSFWKVWTSQITIKENDSKGIIRRKMDMFDRSPRSIFFSHIKGNTEKNY